MYALAALEKNSCIKDTCSTLRRMERNHPLRDPRIDSVLG
ncbi:hypothetical protein [Epibacterium ulvae]